MGTNSGGWPLSSSSSGSSRGSKLVRYVVAQRLSTVLVGLAGWQALRRAHCLHSPQVYAINLGSSAHAKLKCK
jgi:hypothetical protein